MTTAMTPTMTIIHPAPLLKSALLLDAAATGALGAAQLGLGAALVPLLQLPAALIFESGLFMAVYAATLVLMARSGRLPAALVRLIIIGNVGWALGAFALALWLAPGALGQAFLAAHALAVLLFAGLEQAGLSRSAAALPTAGAVAH